MKKSKMIFVFAVAYFFLWTTVTVFCQTESLDIIQYTPPKGWTKTPKDGVMVYSDSNKSTNGLCILTVYPSKTSVGSPQKDFDDQWNELIVKPFKAEANPKTDTQTQDGWTSVTGASRVESDGVKLAVLMTVITGYGRTASVFALLNDESYFPQIDAFMTSVKMDKVKALANAKVPSSPTSVPGKSSDYLDFDPFPDKPRIQPQQPLIGRLRKTISVADLAGTWEIGSASVMEYISSSTQSQTSVSFGRTKYVINANGTYEGKFQGPASNTTIRESERGTIILSGGFIIKRDSNNRELKYQFVAFMIQPNGAAVLSMIYLGENPPLDADALRANCGHAHGYITCLNGDEWVRIP